MFATPYLRTTSSSSSRTLVVQSESNHHSALEVHLNELKRTVEDKACRLDLFETHLQKYFQQQLILS
jgi:hypothetical protein